MTTMAEQYNFTVLLWQKLSDVEIVEEAVRQRGENAHLNGIEKIADLCRRCAEKCCG